MKESIYSRIISLLLVLASILSLCGCGIITIKPASPGGLQPTATPTPSQYKGTTAETARYTVNFEPDETFETEAEHRRAEHIDSHIKIAVQVMNTIPENKLVYDVHSFDYSNIQTERDKITNPDELYIYDLICQSARSFTSFKINAKTLGLSAQDYNNAFFSAVDRYHIDHPELYLYADTCTDSGYDKLAFYTPGKWLDYMTDDTESIKKDLNMYYRVIDRIIEKMPENLTNLEKCIYFSIVIASSVKYDHAYKTLKNTYQCFNALTYGNAVCGGYALALQELCKRENIGCEYVTGYSPDQDPETSPIGHAWVKVKTDKGPVHMDVTWYDTDEDFTLYTDGLWMYLLMSEDKLIDYGYVVND